MSVDLLSIIVSVAVNQRFNRY